MACAIHLRARTGGLAPSASALTVIGFRDVARKRAVRKALASEHKPPTISRESGWFFHQPMLDLSVGWLVILSEPIRVILSECQRRCDSSPLSSSPNSLPPDNRPLTTSNQQLPSQIWHLKFRIVRSMGPRPFSRGKQPTPVPRQFTRQASMGPRPFSRGKLRSPLLKLARSWALQWGRDHSVAESALYPVWQTAH